MQFFKAERKTLFLLAILTLISFFVGYLSIKNNGITFWFDQSRDAYIARNIIEDHDLKILGPSASGTNDAVYHGVLYYYFLAPLYYFGGGNPMIPATVLLFMGCLGIFPLYYFAKSFFASPKISWLVVLTYAFSVEVIQFSYWLSNPSMAVVPLIVFYWSLWEFCFKNQKSFTIPLVISLGVSLQSALWLIYLFGPLLVACLYNLDHFAQKSILKDWKNNFKFITILFLLVASILVGQLMLWKNGVFLNHGLELSNKVPELSVLLPLLKNYLMKIMHSIGPYTPIATAFILIVIIIGFFKIPKINRIFLLSWILGPFWLFLIQARTSIHILISLEVAVMLILAFVLVHMWQQKSYGLKVMAASMMGVYLFSNLMMLRVHKFDASSIFSPQQGTSLAHQLALIDYTYAKAKGANFSFSAFANPNGYYITWAYLYDWYGYKKYGYKPTYVGPDQTGLFGEELLKRDDVSRDQFHFTIIEPNLEVLPQITRDLFAAEQDRLAPATEREKFGSTIIEFRPI